MSGQGDNLATVGSHNSRQGFDIRRIRHEAHRTISESHIGAATVEAENLIVIGGVHEFAVFGKIGGVDVVLGPEDIGPGSGRQIE